MKKQKLFITKKEQLQNTEQMIVCKTYISTFVCNYLKVIIFKLLR